MGLRHLFRAPVSILAEKAGRSLKTLVGVSTVMVLVAACNMPPLPASPTPASTSAQAVTPPASTPAQAVTSPASTPAQAVTSPASTPAQAVATPSPSPLATVAGTPGKKEEREITPTAGEEPAEGPPLPNPLPTLTAGGNPLFAPVPGVDMLKNGAAASIHGSATQGQIVYAQNCQACHNTDGKGGLANPGSDDGTVPPLNPIDPGFKATAKGDPAAFARQIDLFIQHGSRPAGANPTLSMIPWGDQNKLTQQQIADVEAYVMQLNGISWPSQ